MTSEHSWRVSKHVGVEGALARHKPPRLDKAIGPIYPLGSRNGCLACEELCRARERRIKAPIAGAGRLVVQQGDLASSRGRPEIIGEPEDRSKGIGLVTALKLILNRQRQLLKRCGTTPDTRTGMYVKVVLACVEQALQCLESWSTYVGLVRGNCWLGGFSQARQLNLRQASRPPGVLEERCYTTGLRTQYTQDYI